VGTTSSEARAEMDASYLFRFISTLRSELVVQTKCDNRPSNLFSAHTFYPILHMLEKRLFDLFANISATTRSDPRAEMDPNGYDASISALASELVVPTTLKTGRTTIFHQIIFC
jgi:hypothetical protein